MSQSQKLATLKAASFHEIEHLDATWRPNKIISRLLMMASFSALLLALGVKLRCTRHDQHGYTTSHTAEDCAGNDTPYQGEAGHIM